MTHISVELLNTLSAFVLLSFKIFLLRFRNDYACGPMVPDPLREKLGATGYLPSVPDG